ncbi:hypothetical protein ACXDJA_002616 [Klebsiella variicola]
MVNYDAFYSGNIWRLSNVSDEELNFWVMVVANGWEKEAHPNRMNLTFLGGNTAHWDVADEVDTIPDYCRDIGLYKSIAKENNIVTKSSDSYGPVAGWESISPGIASAFDPEVGRSICLAYIAMHMSE